MQLRSLGYRTDLVFHRFEGEVVDRGDCLVVRTPGNPGYRWGNFLLFARPPEDGDLERWLARFAAEIGTPPGTSHVALGWDGPAGETGAIGPFLEAGFKLEESIVLTAERLRLPPKVTGDVELRPIETEADYAEALELQVLIGVESGEDETGYRAFRARKLAGYRRMIDAGLGRWFGAFLNGRLVADMGLFWQGELARFQSVATHPGYRRRGLCGTLLHWVGRYGLERPGVRRLVIVADAHYHAVDIYRSVGFEPTERQLGLERVEKER